MASPLLTVAESIRLGHGSLPLLGHANIWIEDSLADRTSIHLTQSVIQAALEETAPGQLEIVVFDDALSGVAAPFWSLNAGGEKLLHATHDEEDFKATLKFLRDHVQGVNNVVQGLAENLPTFRRAVDFPVESYKLVVVSTDVSMLDDDAQAQLGILMKAGPAAGVSFVIHSMTLGVNPFLVSMCERLAVKRGAIERAGAAPLEAWTPPSAQLLSATSQRIVHGRAAAQMDPIAFHEVETTAQMWTHSSDDGVTFALGRYGADITEVTLGDEMNQRHNLLVTGAVGQGKSNLLGVMIHSLCQRYSPDELELYLLDFKEGVTLQPFAAGPNGEYLPHARVLGLDADREFGLSVLRQLFDIYKERMRIFKAAGVQNIRQYRAQHPAQRMPRIVTVIDEFQMMFAERDRMSDEIADLLTRGARLFRASGIHIVLASQTIGGNLALMGTSGDGLFGQVPVRIALKNSVNESHATLSDRNDAAAHLRAREAIVNLDYGAPAANRKVAIAFADESALAPLRHQWWSTARSTNGTPPFVFEGERRASVATWVRDHANDRAEGDLLLPIGSRVEVDAGALLAPFGRDVGRNVAVFGTGDAVTQIQSMVFALAAQRSGIRIAFLDATASDPERLSATSPFVECLTAAGARIDIVDRSDAERFLIGVASDLREGDDQDDLLIVGLGLDRLRSMPFEFQTIAKDGPACGVHTIGWWLKHESFKEHAGYGGESHFDIRIALRLDPQSTKQVMSDPLLDWRPEDNRILAWDAAHLPAAIRVVPYSTVDPAELRRSIGGIAHAV